MACSKLIASAAILALASCSAAADQTDAAVVAAQTAAPPHFERNGGGLGLSCDVTARPTANGVLIEAVAFANRDVDGEYDLAITKSGRGGSSDVTQGGAVSIAAGSEAVLGQTELSVERGARIRANLVVRDAQGELCRQSFRL